MDCQLHPINQLFIHMFDLCFSNNKKNTGFIFIRYFEITVATEGLQY